MLSRDLIYDLLRATIDRYSIRLKSAEMEIFADEMLSTPLGGGSIDPALRAVFEQMVPATLQEASTAMELAARYVDEELVQLRNIHEAMVLVRDLREAARSKGKRPEGLWDWPV